MALLPLQNYDILTTNASFYSKITYLRKGLRNICINISL